MLMHHINKVLLPGGGEGGGGFVVVVVKMSKIVGLWLRKIRFIIQCGTIIYLTIYLLLKITEIHSTTTTTTITTTIITT